MFHKLQYISQGNTAVEQLSNIRKALDAGCEWIQLRWKNAEENQLAKLAEEVKLLSEAYKATYILNDHAFLARETDADGVHLGLSDMRIAEARAILGNEKIIGGTANTYEDVLQRIDESCDYVGLGPLKFTATKAKLSPILGLEGYRSIIQKLNEENKVMPIFAIGGIELEDLESLMETGVYGIAVSGLVTHHADPQELIKQLNTKLYVPVKNS